MIVALCYLSQTNIRNGIDTNGITMNSASSISVYMIFLSLMTTLEGTLMLSNVATVLLACAVIAVDCLPVGWPMLSRGGYCRYRVGG